MDHSPSSERMGSSFRENVRVPGTIYKCQKPATRRVLELSADKRSVLSVCHGRTSYDTLVHCRKIIASAPVRSIIPGPGSGTAVFALAPIPLGTVLPKLDRHTL